MTYYPILYSSCIISSDLGALFFNQKASCFYKMINPENVCMHGVLKFLLKLKILLNFTESFLYES